MIRVWKTNITCLLGVSVSVLYYCLRAMSPPPTPPKDGDPYHFVITRLRTLLSFEILRSVQMSVRGSRKLFCKMGDFKDNCRINFIVAGIPLILLCSGAGISSRDVLRRFPLNIRAVRQK